MLQAMVSCFWVVIGVWLVATRIWYVLRGGFQEGGFAYKVLGWVDDVCFAVAFGSGFSA